MKGATTVLFFFGGKSTTTILFFFFVMDLSHGKPLTNIIIPCGHFLISYNNFSTFRQYNPLS